MTRWPRRRHAVHTGAVAVRAKIDARDVERRAHAVRQLITADPAAALIEAHQLMADVLASVATWGDTESRRIAATALEVAADVRAGERH